MRQPQRKPHLHPEELTCDLLSLMCPQLRRATISLLHRQKFILQACMFACSCQLFDKPPTPSSELSNLHPSTWARDQDSEQQRSCHTSQEITLGCHK